LRHPRAAATAWRIALFVGAVTAALWHGPGRAGDLTADLGPWQALEVRGTVFIRAANEASTNWLPLAPAAPITAASEVATGADGEAILGNGIDRIRVTANSRLVLPAAEEGDLLTRIRQRLGTLFFDVGPRPDRRFEVDAPYLVVLVKGTRFSVRSSFTADSVALSRGTVEVRPQGGPEVSGALLHPGETATVSAGSNTVTVGASPAGAGPSSPAGATDRGRRGDASHDFVPRALGPQPEPEPKPGGGGDGGGGDGGDPGDGSGGDDGGGSDDHCGDGHHHGVEQRGAPTAG
jgi:hypothetical protein